MQSELNRKTQKIFRRIIFNVETYPLATILLVCIYFLLVSGRIDFYDKPDNINFPESFGDVTVCRLEGSRVCVIYLTKNKSVYLDIDDEEIRKALLNNVGNFYKKQFSANEITLFSKGTYFGNEIQSFNLKNNKFHKSHTGIPHEGDNNQLSTWISCLNKIDESYQFKLIADKDLPCEEIDKVLKSLQANGINRITLLTNFVTRKS